MELISVIIPAYNAEKTIDECIASVLKQTYKCFELIIVNDGSSDSTRGICEKAAEADKRIILINQENGGVSSARNRGLEAAAGDYIAFIDADDTVSESYLENMFNSRQPDGVVIAGYKMLLPLYVTNYYVPGEKTVFPMTEIGSHFAELYDKRHVFNPPFSKLYSRTLIAGQRFDESVSVGEDLLFNLEYLKKCASIALVPFTDYNYYFLDESAMKRPHDNDLGMQLRVFEAVRGFCCEYGVEQSDRITCSAFCGSGFRVFETLIYSSLPKKEIGARIKKWFGCGEFIYACKICGHSDLSVKVFAALCRLRSVGIITCFFRIKNLLKKIYYSLRSKRSRSAPGEGL